MGEASLPEGEKYSVKVTSSPLDKTLTFIDNGIGMTKDEVEKYINQIAFSGAQDFLEKYKDKDAGEQIIGHFGLGFYSAFMVADKVTIETLSYKEGAEPVYWESEGGTEYEMSEGNLTERGTRITLYLSEDSVEFANEYRVKEVINKYCAFMPVEIYYINEDEAKKQDKVVEAEAKISEEDELIGDVPKKEEKKEEAETKTDKELQPLNDTNPLWMRMPADCTDEEYKEFYQKVFYDFKEPLFWIHLNMDYPFNLKGILYFPRINPNTDQLEGKVKLFNNQVFVADNIKEIVPEFLLLLRGVLDCPDLPLNVSRSFLQNDGYVKRLSSHITKKVADKLNGLMNTEREKYETYWDDIHPFVKYGCLRDEKFYEQIKGSLLLKTTAGEHYTLEEYKSRNEGKTDKKVYYTSDPARQAASVRLYTDRGIDVAVMDSLIDISFMQFLENAGGEENAISFARVDADTDGLVDSEAQVEELPAEALEKLFRAVTEDENLTVKLQPLKDKELPLMLLEDEQMRRWREASVYYGSGFSLPEKPEVVLNSACPAIRALAAMGDEDLQKMLARQYFDIARMSSRPLEKEELSRFIANSYKLAARLAEKE